MLASMSLVQALACHQPAGPGPPPYTGINAGWLACCVRCRYQVLAGAAATWQELPQLTLHLLPLLPLRAFTTTHHSTLVNSAQLFLTAAILGVLLSRLHPKSARALDNLYAKCLHLCDMALQPARRSTSIGQLPSHRASCLFYSLARADHTRALLNPKSHTNRARLHQT